MLFDIIEALVLGVLAGVTVIYTFQTRIVYPAWLLRTYDHPWILLLVLLAAVIISQSSPRIAVMIVLLLFAMWVDWVLFARALAPPNDQNDINTANHTDMNGEKPVAEVWPYTDQNEKRVENTTQASMPFADPMYYDPLASLDVFTDTDLANF